MNAEEFVQAWRREKDSLVKNYTQGENETAVSEYLSQMNLDQQQAELLNKAIEQMLTDTFYSLLIGLDGAGSIGGVQHTFKLLDEDENLISDCGDIEAEAWEQFQSDD